MQLYDNQYVKQSLVTELLTNAYGSETADYVKYIASLDDFQHFAYLMSALGLPRFDDDPEHHYRNSDTNTLLSPIVNAILLSRYPFLSGMYNIERYQQENNTKDLFACNDYHSINAGWARRFGLELCEDISTLLRSTSDPVKAFDYYHVEDVKEKYGTLRWYDGGYTVEIADALEDLNMLYESLSERTCSYCGTFSNVRITNSYVLPECLDCLTKQDVRNYDESRRVVTEKLSELGYHDQWNYVPYKIQKLVEQLIALEITNPNSSIADNVIVSTYVNGAQIRHNVYERLKSINPDLHVFKLVDAYDLQFISDTKDTDYIKEEIKKEVDNERNKERTQYKTNF